MNLTLQKRFTINMQNSNWKDSEILKYFWIYWNIINTWNHIGDHATNRTAVHRVGSNKHLWNVLSFVTQIRMFSLYKLMIFCFIAILKNAIEKLIKTMQIFYHHLIELWHNWITIFSIILNSQIIIWGNTQRKLYDCTRLDSQKIRMSIYLHWNVLLRQLLFPLHAIQHIDQND